MLIITDYADRSNLGGAARVVIETSAHLARIGDEVWVLHGGPRDEELHDHRGVRFTGIEYFPSRDRKGVENVAGLWNFLVRMRKAATRILRDARPDVINVHQPLAALSLLRLAGHGKVPLVYTFHSSWASEYSTDRHSYDRGIHPADFLGFASRRIVESLAIRNSSDFLTLSQFMKSELMRMYGIDKERISVTGGGFNSSIFFPAASRLEVRRRVDVPEESILLLCVRRLIRRTGIAMMLDAFFMARKRLKNLYLIIIGDGPLKVPLTARARELGIEDCTRFEGVVPDARLADYYRAADLVVMPSVALEGFGLVVVESLACGTPVLVTPIGGMPEVVRPLDRALICEEASAASLSDKVVDLCSNRKYLEDMRDSCARYALERYTWEVVTEKMRQVFLRYASS